MGRLAPEHIHHWPVLGIYCLDDSVRKLLPALPLVGIGLVGAYSEDRIQHQYALLSPFHQIAVVGDPTAQVIVEFLINIHQRGGRLYLWLYRKAEAMRLPGIVVRILPQDQHLDLT